METKHNHSKFDLFEAAKNGDCGKFTTLGDEQKDEILSFRTSHRQDTLLHIASVFGHHELTKDIANRFPELVTRKNFIGDTPLHVAARGGKLLVVESLIPKADDLLAVNEDGNTPLHEAVIHNRNRVVLFLLKQKQDLRNVLKVNKKGKSPLYLAVESRNARIVSNILNLFESVLSDAIPENTMGGSKRITYPSGTNIASTSQTNQVDVDIETKIRIADPSGTIIAGTSQTNQVDVDIKTKMRIADPSDTNIAGTSQTNQVDVDIETKMRIADPSNTNIASTSQTNQVDVDIEPKMRIADPSCTNIASTSQTNQVDIETKMRIADPSGTNIASASQNNQVNVDIETKMRIADPSDTNIASTSRTNQVDVDIETKMCILRVAITGKDIGILRMVAETLAQSLPDNNNLLHLAASLGFLDGVKYLLDRKVGMDVLRHDEDGFCPIHLASKNGHLHVTKVLLDHYPDAREFLSKRHQNILHVAAENGKDNIVKYILKTKWAEFLINEKDKDGYTPLHLGTKNWHVKVVSALTWAPGVDLKQVNEEGLTALEVAEKNMKVMAPFKKRLTWIALRSAGTPRTHIKDPETVKRFEAKKFEPYNMGYCKARVNTLLLVSALVATVTFTAGFTMPGGNNNSGSHVGMASMVHKIPFQLFLICDSIAVYSSIIVTVMLMWAQLGDLNLMLNALRKAQRLLGLSLAMMSLAFLAGVDLVVTESHWLSIITLVMGIASLIILLALFLPLFLPYRSKLLIFRYISYYPFKVLMLIS